MPKVETILLPGARGSGCRAANTRRFANSGRPSIRIVPGYFLGVLLRQARGTRGVVCIFSSVIDLRVIKYPPSLDAT